MPNNEKMDERFFAAEVNEGETPTAMAHIDELDCIVKPIISTALRVFRSYVDEQPTKISDQDLGEAVASIAGAMQLWERIDRDMCSTGRSATKAEERPNA
ncbi:MAG: hypothetical protein JW884_11920 [Deltaproteobacteria bacterium]|nr:hypothetical protein [Deltaproteobacteria bacterium]